MVRSPAIAPSEISTRKRLSCAPGSHHSRRVRQEVMAWVVSGLLNKQIAGELGISEETVKVHRGHVMRKMEADSLAELVRMSERLGIRD